MCDRSSMVTDQQILWVTNAYVTVVTTTRTPHTPAHKAGFIPPAFCSLYLSFPRPFKPSTLNFNSMRVSYVLALLLAAALCAEAAYGPSQGVKIAEEVRKLPHTVILAWLRHTTGVRICQLH